MNNLAKLFASIIGRLKSALRLDNDPVYPSELKEMFTHVEESPEIFRPSLFWKYYEDKNLKQLSAKGLAHFKRTINQNYFNWVPESFADNQFRSLLRLSAEFPSPDAFKVKISDKKFFEDLAGQNPLRDPNQHELYRLFLGMLWAYTLQSDPNALCGALSEPELGDPIQARLNGRLISQDLATSIRERNAICEPLEADLRAGKKISVVEIGAGYGRLGYVMLRTTPSKYTIVDIPPALYVSQWYLTNLFPDKQIFRFRGWRDYNAVETELNAADISFLTPDQFAALPDRYFDIGISISNLAEMTEAQLHMYIGLLDRTVSRFVYMKQWIDSFNNFDDRRYIRTDFDLPMPWVKHIDRVDAVQDRFFETLWRRV